MISCTKFFTLIIVLSLFQQRIERNELIAKAVLNALAQVIGVVFLIKLIRVHRWKNKLDGVGYTPIVEFGQ